MTEASGKLWPFQIGSNESVIAQFRADVYWGTFERASVRWEGALVFCTERRLVLWANGGKRTQIPEKKTDQDEHVWNIPVYRIAAGGMRCSLEEGSGRRCIGSLFLDLGGILGYGQPERVDFLLGDEDRLDESQERLDGFKRILSLVARGRYD